MTCNGSIFNVKLNVIFGVRCLLNPIWIDRSIHAHARIITHFNASNIAIKCQSLFGENDIAQCCLHFCSAVEYDVWSRGRDLIYKMAGAFNRWEPIDLNFSMGLLVMLLLIIMCCILMCHHHNGPIARAVNGIRSAVFYWFVDASNHIQHFEHHKYHQHFHSRRFDVSARFLVHCSFTVCFPLKNVCCYYLHEQKSQPHSRGRKKTITSKTEHTRMTIVE